MTTFWPRAAGPNWAATSPAAEDTAGIRAMFEASGTQQARHRRTSRVGLLFTSDVVEAGRRPLVEELTVGVRHRSARKPDRRRVEVRTIGRRRKEPARVADVRYPIRRHRVSHELNLADGRPPPQPLCVAA